jgi:hypothetical protein
MRFKTQLGLHPAWSRSVHVPAALLNHYRALGLDNNTLLYVLQIIAAYWRGEEANHVQIAEIMGFSSDRALRRYNSDLERLGLAKINGRYLHGNRLENDYDLTPLLDAVSLLDVSTRQQQQTAEKNAFRLVQSLVNALEQGQDVSGMLVDLVGQWKTLNAPEPTGSYDPVETGSYDPVETGSYDPVETGSYDPVETGSHDPVSIGSYDPVVTTSSLPDHTIRLKADRTIRGLLLFPPTDSLEETTTDNNGLVTMLHEIGFTNGDAHKAIVTAVQQFGDDGFGVLRDWLDYVATQDTIRNPAGLIRARLREGQRPPRIPEANGVAVPAVPEIPQMREI